MHPIVSHHHHYHQPLFIQTITRLTRVNLGHFLNCSCRDETISSIQSNPLFISLATWMDLLKCKIHFAVKDVGISGQECTGSGWGILDLVVIRTFLHQWRLLLLLANEGGLNEITTVALHWPWLVALWRLSIFGINICYCGM